MPPATEPKPTSTLEQKIKLLNEDLDKNLVKKHPFSGFDYLEGYTVINAANRIFGYFGWSSEIKVELIREYKLPDSDKGTPRGMVMIPVTIEVYDGDDTITKSDIGTCPWAGEDQIETAIKGAATDGLKRAFRQLGKQFGNDLYEKDESSHVTGPATSYQPRQAKQQGIMTELGMNTSQKPPLCDKCNMQMTLRKGSRGPFWGCSGYPNCKSIVNIDEVDINGNRLDGSGPKNTPPVAQPAQPENIPMVDIPEEPPVNMDDVPF